MSASEIVVYQSDDGSLRVECRFEDQRVWLTQAQMATLSQTTPQHITQHLRAIHAEGDLQQSATCVKAEDDEPTIGLRLRRRQNRLVAGYALHGIDRPIGVAEYLLTRARPAPLDTDLPSIEALETELSRELALHGGAL